MSTPTDSALDRITAAAIRRDIDNHVFTLPPPARHPEIITHIVDTSNGTIKRVGYGYKQGFVTQAGRFVDRKEACGIARAAGQIEGKPKGERNLFSKDLW